MRYPENSVLTSALVLTAAPLYNDLMTYSPFTAMQSAVDIVLNSPHNTNKIAAALFGIGPDGQPFCVRATNHWPDPILHNIGEDTRIGECSGTVHAEMACIISSPLTKGASICITDPFCPNCAKNMAEAGIKAVYLDHKGFSKDFAARRADEFLDLSLAIVARAGIAVYEINRKAESITPLFIPHADHPLSPDLIPIITKPAAAADQKDLLELVHFHTPVLGHTPFAAAYVTYPSNQTAEWIITPQHCTLGYTLPQDCDLHTFDQKPMGKYTPIMEPINRLLAQGARRGGVIQKDHLFSSRIPTSRELVNMVGAGIKTLTLLNIHPPRDPESVQALSQLQNAGILTLTTGDDI